MSKDENESTGISRRALIGLIGGGTVTAGAIGYFGYNAVMNGDDEVPEEVQQEETDFDDPRIQELHDSIDRGEVVDDHPEIDEEAQKQIDRENEEISNMPKTGASPVGE